MKQLIVFSIKQKVFFNLLFVLLMVMGAFGLLRMPVERYPNIAFSKVIIDTFLPGASAADVEALITREIEDCLDDLENVEYITSTSYRERSSILVKFIDDTDYMQGYEELRLKVLSILDELPPEAEPPKFNYLDVNDWMPAITINIYGNRSNRALTLMAEEMKIVLRQIKDVNEVRLSGEYTREFHVLLDPAKMRTLGITFEQVAGALKRADILIPAGDFTVDQGEFVIKVDERFRDRQQVMDTIIRRDSDSSFVTVNDVASNGYLSYRDPLVKTSVNGIDCVTLQIIKNREGNVLKVVREVRKTMEQFAPVLAGEGVKAILTQDSTVKISDSIRVLGFNLLLGIILVCLLIWYFMGLRSAALTTIGIPFSFLASMAVMYFTGNSINELSLFSFVLVSGIIVDDAIVVVENINRHCHTGKPLIQSVIDGTSEVFLPVVAATLTTVAAFLPMLIMTGNIGEFFSIIPKTVSIALLASLIECLFILPIHYLDFGTDAKDGDVIICKPNSDPDGLDNDNRFLAVSRKIFDYLLRLALRFRWTSLGIVGLAFIAAMTIAILSITGKAPLIKVKFFPDDYSLYYIEIDGPIGTPLETTAHLIKQIAEKVAAEGPETAESAVGYAGFYLNENYHPVWGNHLGHVAVTLPAKNIRHFADYPKNDVVRHLEWIKKEMAGFTDSGFTLRVRAEKDGPPAGKDVNIRILGTDMASVSGLSAEILNFLRQSELGKELVELNDGQGLANRICRFKILPERAAEYDLTVSQAALLAASVLDGRNVGRFRLADEEVDVKVKIDPAAVSSLADALDVPIIEYSTGPVRLGEICELETSLEEGYLKRFQGQRAITIQANIRFGSSLSAPAIVERVKGFYRTVRDKYPGATLNFAGEYESTSKSYTSLTYAFIIAIMLIYVILATQFNSYLHPVAILSAVVFSLIGVVFGTFFSRSLFTVNSFIAVVGVTGVVVNDSLVLIEFINKRYQSGLSRYEAIIQGTHIRLRPILLTTLTTTLGLLPMALGIPEYSLVWGAMARTFVTGLCTSTVLTIFLVPVQWDIFERLKERKNA